MTPRRDKQRERVLRLMRVAGYHGDERRWTLLYVENLITFRVARDAFDAGRLARSRGVVCNCRDCTAVSKEP